MNQIQIPEGSYPMTKEALPPALPACPMPNQRRHDDQGFHDGPVEHELLALVLEMIPFVVFWKDRSSRYLGCNLDFAKIAGLASPEDIVGLTDHDLPWSQADAENYQADDQRVIDTGEARLHVVEPRQVADGTKVWVDTSKVPLRDKNGDITGVVGVYADVTQQRLNEKLLRDTRSQLDLAIRAMDSAIVLYDREERFVFCNEKYRELYFPDCDIPLHGQTYGDILTDFALANPEIVDIDAWVSERLTQHRKCEQEWTQVLNGRTIRVSDNRTSDGGIVSLRTDVSAFVAMEEELRIAKEEAEAASAAKSRFLAGMSHEIRTPMTAILGFTEILLAEARQGQLDPTSAVQSLSTIKRNGDSLLNLINDILDLSKVESGKLEAQLQAVSPVEVLHDVVELLTMRATAANVDLKLSASGPIPTTIASDPARLHQILVNLVGNAIKFSGDGQVTLEPRWVHDSAGGRLEISVIDTGIGMTPEELARIFTPFEQASTATSQRYGGTGLGLAISSGLAALLNGTISAESTPGEGSRFTLSLRVAEPGQLTEPALDARRFCAASATVPAREAGEPAPNLAGRRVLLAEDGRDNQLLISKVLSKAGATVECASDGVEALERLRATRLGSDPIDLVLMDMQMPRLDGYAATRQLRNEGFDLPVIALTANAMSGDRDECLAAGCTDYLTKPVNFQRLVGLCVTSLADAA